MCPLKGKIPSPPPAAQLAALGIYIVKKIHTHLFGNKWPRGNFESVQAKFPERGVAPRSETTRLQRSEP
jgi:hypothetical protein